MDCPKCGSTVSHQGFSTVECTGTDCDNNPQRGKNFDWCEFLTMNITHENQIEPLKAYAERNRHHSPYPTRAEVQHILDLFKT